jgi:hypothetical protein
LGATVSVAPTHAQAEEPRFGVFDIPTVFFISKSDDRNRVDFGMHLDKDCAPAKSDAVFPYWREFERSPPVRIHALGMFEYLAYGVSQQSSLGTSVTGAEYFIRLRQEGRPIWITTSKDATGHCTALARTDIGATRFAELLSIHVHLAGLLSVDYIDIKGKDLLTGKLIEERVRHQAQEP